MYENYQSLTLKRHDGGILEIIMGASKSANQKLSTADHTMHRELSTIWLDVDRDPQTRVALIRGEEKGFSAGGDFRNMQKSDAARGAGVAETAASNRRFGTFLEMASVFPKALVTRISRSGRRSTARFPISRSQSASRC